MLNLTRRIGESVYIGDAITVTITAVNGTQVRIGVGAPPEVRIVREELLTRPPPDPGPV